MTKDDRVRRMDEIKTAKSRRHLDCLFDMRHKCFKDGKMVYGV
jgi:hypothetical protein